MNLFENFFCVVKRETPPGWRWKFCEFQHRKSISVSNLIVWRGLASNYESFSVPGEGILVPLERLSFRDVRKQFFSGRSFLRFRSENVVIKVKYLQSFSLKNQNLWYWGTFVNPGMKTLHWVIDPLTWYSPFRGRWDSKCWIKWKSKSWMVVRF